ncbi:uncharacterized protein LOC113298253 [Papaver somniferum]|uniref:uncharacterized protein LOC113298253 n=1 Tax=Papaver somniferum TaxID=3469 RepID=UPI000E6F56FB|nr:uncharacterized protein LOC113298253 [Papaver somniferum]
MLLTSSATTSQNFSCKLPLLAQQQRPKGLLLEDNKSISSSSFTIRHCNPKHFRSTAHRLLITRVCSYGGTSPHLSTSSTEARASERKSSRSDNGSLALLIRMLGQDNDPLDREEAVIALWKYSQGGKEQVEEILQFRDCINLAMDLLRSDSSSTCEAAAGLLRSISAVDQYRDLVAESGAIDEISSLLSRPSLTAEVKEQMICALWNFSMDEKHRINISNTDLLPMLINSVDDEGLKVQEAAGCALANLALSPSNHQVMVEAGVIPKLTKFLRGDTETSKVIRKEAKQALLELAKDDDYRILIIEEGLVLVPIVGADAYKSFKVASHSWPSLPDGTEFERGTSTPSRYGASELLLGLNIHDKKFDLEEAKVNAIVGRTQEQFLARIGAIEIEDGNILGSEFSASEQNNTLLPWVNGVARLILILGLEDASAISRAAWSIGDASINEHMRMSFMIAGAVKILVRLLDHNNEKVRLAVTHALWRLSLSVNVSRIIGQEDAVDQLVNALKDRQLPEDVMRKTMDILARVLDPGKEMEVMFSSTSSPTPMEFLSKFGFQ